MSKSMGNVIVPQKIIDQYGMDILRLWVAASDYTDDVRASDSLFEGVAHQYRRIRNHFKYLISNLWDFNPDDSLIFEQLPPIEQAFLSVFAKTLQIARQSYESYAFHKVFRALDHFATSELSAVYCDLRKDILYCDPHDSLKRRAVCTVLYKVYKGLLTYYAPVLPFTTEEAWQYRTAYGSTPAQASIHLETFLECDQDIDEARIQDWHSLTLLRQAVYVELECFRQKKEIGSSAQAAVNIYVSASYYKRWKSYDLSEYLIVASAQLYPLAEAPSDAKSCASFSLELSECAIHAMVTQWEKCPRCWRHVESIDATHHLCPRCITID